MAANARARTWSRARASSGAKARALARGAAEDRPETEDEAREWSCEAETCAIDPAYFIDRHGMIDRPKAAAAGDAADLDLEPDQRGRGPGPVRFRLWPAQVALMGTLVKCKQVIILKARQLGISWLVCGYVLWFCLFHANQEVILLSKGQEEANELIRRIRALYERLPWGLRSRLAKLVGKPSVRKLEWSNGSRVKSLPSTRSAGVSFTASLVVMDEASRMVYGQELYDAIRPAVEAGGQLFLMSTANGFGGLFHSTWMRAVRGLNSFACVFLPWWSRPGRDAAWYRRVLRDANDPRIVPQEYPANPTEAFVASGRCRFEQEWVVKQAKGVEEPLPARMWPSTLRGIPRLRVYRLPVPGRRYAIPADVAEGLERGDYDAAPVVDEETWEEVACLHGRWEPDVFAGYLIEVGYAYNTATIVPERNNHGHAVLATLKIRQYPAVGLGHDGGRGWLTNAKTKDPGVDALAEALRLGTVTIRTQATLDEMATYQRLKDGTTGAPEEGDFHDDLVMAWYVLVSYLRQGKLRKAAGIGQAPAVGGVSTRPSGILSTPGRPGPLGFPGGRGHGRGTGWGPGRG